MTRLCPHVTPHVFPEDKGCVPGSPGRRRDDPALCLCLLLPDEYGDRDRLSPDFYEESETDPGAEEPPARIFVALFDYDPLSMSPNPDAAEEELPFKEGQIIKVGRGRRCGGAQDAPAGRGTRARCPCGSRQRPAHSALHRVPGRQGG